LHPGYAALNRLADRRRFCSGPDQAIAACALGLVERSVDALEEGFGVVVAQRVEAADA
jgi:uncharacterized protein (DUF2342 family)